MEVHESRAASRVTGGHLQEAEEHGRRQHDTPPLDIVRHLAGELPAAATTGIRQAGTVGCQDAGADGELGEGADCASHARRTDLGQVPGRAQCHHAASSATQDSPCMVTPRPPPILCIRMKGDHFLICCSVRVISLPH